jgi:Predicted glycosyltransferases
MDRPNGSEEPLITVVTPYYNNPTLFEAVDSVLSQNYPSIQYFLVDDASEIFSADMVREYISTRKTDRIRDFRVMENPVNAGIVKSVNKAYRQAEGAYLFNLAADDVFADESVLRDWVRAFQSTEALVMTAYRDVYDETLQKKVRTLPTAVQVKMIRKLDCKLLFNDLILENYIFGCCTAKSRRCIQKHGLLSEDYRLIDDYPMNLYWLRNGVPIYFFDRVVIKYRSGGTSAPINNNKAYEKDSDLVFRQEILKYASHPVIATIKYTYWKIRHLRTGAYFHELQSVENSWQRLWLLIKYPENILRFFKRKLAGPKRS